MQIQTNLKDFDLNSNNSTNTKSLSSISVLPIISKTIGQLLTQSFDRLKQKQLLTLIPNFTQNEVMKILNIYLYQSTPNYGVLNPSGLLQEDATKIIKIEKDNLSPKQLPSENPQQIHAINELPQNLSIGSRRLSMTNRSFMKRKPSQISQLITGSTTERTNLQKKLSFKVNDKQISSVEKGQKSIALKKDLLRNFTSLTMQQQQGEDQEIIYLREKVLFNSKERDRQQTEINERLRIDKQKKSKFSSEIGMKGNFTFEFDGSPLVSQELKDEKIKYYEMNVGLKTFSRKFKTIYKHLQQPNTGNPSQQQQQIVKSRTSRKRQPLNETINLQLPLNDIPKFSNEEPQQKAHLRVEEYKKLYGKRFSRYDHPSYTIDISKTLQKNKVAFEDDLIMTKKHLMDSASTSKKHRSFSVNKSYIATKLALPKLQGKYKMLDRYQQI